MAFCNSCGASVEGNAKFCPKCGTAVPANAAATASPMAPAAPAQSGSGLKIVLIVVGVLVGLFIIGACASAFLAWQVARHSRVQQNGENVKVETPFGTVESTTDPGATAKNLGVDLYPGADVVKGTSANMTIGGSHTTAADFETSDSVDKVAEYYKSRFPSANVMSSQGDKFVIMNGDKDNLITINVESQDGKTRIHIARVTKGGGPTS